jgi:hypothetical protein
VNRRLVGTCAIKSDQKVIDGPVVQKIKNLCVTFGKELTEKLEREETAQSEEQIVLFVFVVMETIVGCF